MGNSTIKRKKSSSGSRKKFKQSSKQDNKERDTKIAEATAAAIAANGSPPAINNTPVAKDSIAGLSEHQRPPDRPPYIRSKKTNDMQHRCLMMFPTSGHMGFDIIKMSDELPPIETIREMIAYETRLRLSEPIQELMELYHTNESALT
jgi:hypothetical protein